MGAGEAFFEEGARAAAHFLSRFTVAGEPFERGGEAEGVTVSDLDAGAFARRFGGAAGGRAHVDDRAAGGEDAVELRGSEQTGELRVEADQLRVGGGERVGELFARAVGQEGEAARRGLLGAALE